MIFDYDMALECTMNIEENLNGLKEKKNIPNCPTSLRTKVLGIDKAQQK